MLVPYDSKNLAFANKASTGAAASPFVVAMIDSGIHTLPGFLNGCILMFVFSAANSDIYISSRTLYSLAKEGSAPSFFAHTNIRLPFTGASTRTLWRSGRVSTGDFFLSALSNVWAP
jgi:yeast amino acid transporter